MTGITIPKRPTWNGKTAATITEQARSHAYIYGPRDFPTGLSAGAGWATTPESQNDYGGGGYSLINGNGSWQEWNLGVLKAGTWSVGFWASRGTDRGIIQWSMNGTNFGSTLDRYNNASQQNAPIIDTTVNLIGTGLYTLRMTITGKNASSTDYKIYTHLIALDRTGA